MAKTDYDNMSPDDLAKLLSEELSETQVKDLDSLAERVRALISYSIDRVDYYEDYRTRFLSYSGTLLAFSVAFAAFMVRYSGLPQNVLQIFVFGAVLLMVACLADAGFYLWDSINPSYPHRPVAQTQWYYMYNLPRLDGSKGDYTGDAASKARSWLLDFKDNVKKMSEQGKKEMVLDDIEQLVMLYIITAYKKRFAERMQNALTLGIIAFGVTTIFGILAL
jgi:hypothetical protein